jgi:hypothetical protein
VADLPYTDARNQQSYQQLLWKTFCRRENYQTLLGGWKSTLGPGTPEL